jgi:hypothetical protein
MTRLLAALLLVLAATPAHAQYQPDPNFERVLVPVFYFGGGVNGAQWWTDVNLLNAGPTFDLAFPLIQGNPACPALCGCDAREDVEQLRAETICPIYEGLDGLLLYVPRDVDRDDVHIAARGRDRSRSEDRFGTEVPVIWERDLLAGPMMLLDVPIDPRYRVALRLFDAYQYNTRFTVRFFDMNELRNGRRTLLHETTIGATWDPSRNPANYPIRPSFAFVGDLVAAYPALRNTTTVAIEISGATLLVTPPPPSHRFWALASITNNTTQELTVVSPR